MRKNTVQAGGPQMTIRRMRIAYWITTATSTHAEYVVFIAFPLQQWLHERASMLRNTYEGFLESIRPFWISRESVAWSSCNLAVSQRRTYCASVNSHPPVGLVSRQWDAVDSACVLCNRRIQNDRAGRSASSQQWVCPFYSSRVGFFGKGSHHAGLSAPLQPRIGFLRLLAFTKAKSAFERGVICDCYGHTVHKLSQRRLTADGIQWYLG